MNKIMVLILHEGLEMMVDLGGIIAVKVHKIHNLETAGMTTCKRQNNNDKIKIWLI